MNAAQPAGEVLIGKDGHLGRITLNRPRALNALTLEMVQHVYAALLGWAEEAAVKAVLLDGAGARGLCAGGDIRSMYDAVLAGDFPRAGAFLRAEYRLNASIAAFPKPYIAIMDGIVMGGGIGISAHGSLRIVTERSRLAMPEAGIGFVVDVGGTWLLSRAPGELGTHAALTSMQMGPADAILCGLADLCVPSDRLPSLLAALAACETADALRGCAQAHAGTPPPGVLHDARAWIDRCYAADSVEEIQATLNGHTDPDARRAAEDMAAKSPTSLKVTLRALRQARFLGGLAPCLEQEYRLALQSLRSHDFREGVRAAVVDKDRRPDWMPARLADVSADTVQAFFDAPDHGGLGLAAAI